MASAKTPKTAPKTAENTKASADTSGRLASAIDELFEAARAYKAENPSRSTIVAKDRTFKLEFIGAELSAIYR